MAKVRPIPKGYHTVTAGITLAGAAAFIKFCKKAFGAVEVMKLPGPGGTIMHAELTIGDSRIMLGDEVPGCGLKSATTLGGTPINLHLYVADCDAAFKKAVKAGAIVRMPPTDMFWGDRMASLEDPFGNSWSISTHIEDVDPKELKKRAAQFLKQMQASASAAPAAG